VIGSDQEQQPVLLASSSATAVRNRFACGDIATAL
jgi:hypothetical protein